MRLRTGSRAARRSCSSWRPAAGSHPHPAVAEAMDSSSSGRSRTTPIALRAQQAIIDRFTEETGIEVELVAIGEADLTTPDHGRRRRRTPCPTCSARCRWDSRTPWQPMDSPTPTPHAAVVDALGRDTFAQSALDLVTTDDGLAGVPSDSWAQLLVYRKDLFEAAGLEPPDHVRHDPDRRRGAQHRRPGGHRARHRQRPDASCSRPSSTSPSPTAAMCSTTRATSPSPRRSASRPSTSTRTSSTTAR